MSKNIHLKCFISCSVSKKIAPNKKVRNFFNESMKNDLITNLLPLKLEILDPNSILLPQRGSLKRYDADIKMLQSSNLLLLDASNKRGLGVGVELAFAKENNIPIIALCPQNSHYRKITHDEQGEFEWIHPFILALANHICSDVNSVIKTIKKIYTEG